jgi:hypothetical protein
VKRITGNYRIGCILIGAGKKAIFGPPYMGTADEIRTFIRENDHALKKKE